MSQPEHASPVPYPPPPWQMQSQMWMGIFNAGMHLPLPKGLKPLLNPNWLLISLVRYFAGTLQYDELVVSALVRSGLRMGVVDHFIWVNNEAALWGGRGIWGIPKESAAFTWTEDDVVVTDQQGLIAALSVNRSPKTWLRLGSPASFFGFRDDRCLYTQARMSMSVGKSTMRIAQWSSRFPFRLSGAPLCGFAGNPVQLTVPAPTLITV